MSLAEHNEGRSFIWALDRSRARAALPAAVPCETTAGHGLALSKGFAVSPLLFCPYGRVKPSTLGWGSPNLFRFGRH